MFQAEIEYHKTLEVAKIDLKRRPDWCITAAFNTIDLLQKGFICAESIVRFCALNGFHPSINEVNAIVRRLDANADQKITVAELLQFLTPKNNAAEVFALS